MLLADLDPLLGNCDRSKNREVALRLELDCKAHRGDEPTKDGVARDPLGITFLKFLDLTEANS
jgi:hypothetical protein